MMKIALISNEPPPYRIPVFKRLSQQPGVALLVVFCCRREPNRLWDLPPLDCPHVFLSERIVTVKGRYIHNNPDVIRALKKYAPHVIVTDGFNPTHLYAFMFACVTGRPHVSMTDGTDLSEQGLGRMHRVVRHIVYARSHAYVAASDGGHRLFNRYGIHRQDAFTSCLSVCKQGCVRGP